MELQKKLMNFGGRQVVVYVKAEPDSESGVSKFMNLSKMTKAKLIALADERNVEVSSRMTKTQIIDALESADV